MLSTDDRRSTRGFAVFWVLILYHGVLASNTQCQGPALSLSTKAVADATAEVMWIQTLLQELHINSPRAAKLWCDNIGAKYLSANPVFHARTKHIEVD